MSIEENEDIAVRGLLGAAFGAAEPPLRDLASGSIARGDAVRHRNRLFTAGGAALSVVAVVGTFVAVTGTAPAGNRNPVNQVTSAASTHPTGSLADGWQFSGTERYLDVQQRLPALLQPLLPNGITAGRPPTVTPGEYRPVSILTGPSGTNQVVMYVGSVPPDKDLALVTGCGKGARCETKTVDGGTIYTESGEATAAQAVAGMPVSVLKPGTANTIVAKTLSMTFVPSDHSKYLFHLELGTRTAHVQFADKAPDGYLKDWGGSWPPIQPVSTVHAFDASGLLLTADDFAPMLAKPGLDKLENLLDPRTPVSQDTETRIAVFKAQIAAAAAPALPSGVKAGVDLSMPQPRLLVTGPTGTNQLDWQTSRQDDQYRSQTLGWCPPNVTCSKQSVPGGTMLVWAEKPTDSKMNILSNTPSSYHYWFFPSDSSKPAVNMTLATSAPFSPGSRQAAEYSPVQVSADQFLTAAESGQLSQAIDQTTSLLGSLR